MPINRLDNARGQGWQGALWRWFLALVIVVALAPAAAAQARHPMDALTASEVEHAVALIRAAGYGGDTARYPVVTLREMPKQAVLDWSPGDPITRAAFVVMHYERETTEFEVDLTGGSITSATPIDDEPGVIIDEWLEARELTMADERWRAAIARRGITSLDKIVCSPLTAGYFAADNYGGRRIMKVPCYVHETDGSHLYGRPIEGLYAVVDVEAHEVIDVVDLGVVEVPETPRQATWAREPFKPVVISSPQGANFKLSGAINVEWGPWDFHLRVDRRVGPVISLVRYDDDGRKRMVAYQMTLSEIFVPYMAPGADWSYRGYMDTGEYGTGALLSSLVPGADCPEQAAFVTATVPNDKGRSYQVHRAVCLFERNTGDPLWRHGSPAQPTSLTRPQIEFVVRTIPTIGNYDYVIDWVFTQQGNIDIRVGSAGIVAVKSVASATMDDPTAAADTAHGELVAPGTVAVYHDHFFSFRLDLDVDGPANTMVREQVVPRRLPDSNPRRSLWTIQSGEIDEEGPLSSGGFDSVWRLVNPNATTHLGHNPSFQILPGHQDLSLLAEDDEVQERAAFSRHEMWLTRYKPRELYAAGDYPNLSPGGEGLPAYVADGDAVENTDLVLWFTVGFHHVTRVEDWPIMPVIWHGFTIRPFNFFDEDPAYGIPAAFARPEPPALRSTIDSDSPE